MITFFSGYDGMVAREQKAAAVGREERGRGHERGGGTIGGEGRAMRGGPSFAVQCINGLYFASRTRLPIFSPVPCFLQWTVHPACGWAPLCKVTRTPAAAARCIVELWRASLASPRALCLCIGCVRLGCECSPTSLKDTSRVVKGTSQMLLRLSCRRLR